MKVAAFRLTHLMAPPQTRMLHMDFFRQGERTLLTSSQCDRIFKRTSVGSTLHLSRYRFVAMVRQFGGNGEPRFVECFGVNPRTDSRVDERHGTTGLHADLTEDTHTLVSRTWVPIGKSRIRITRLGANHFNDEFILLGNLLGDVKLELAEGTKHLLTVGYLLPIQPHVGTITDTVEVEDDVFAFLQSGQVERCAIPTTSRYCFGLYAVGCQHTHQGRGNSSRYPTIGFRQSDLPTLC